MGKLLRFARLPFADQALLVEALLWLALWRLLILLFPFKRLMPALSGPEGGGEEALSSLQAARAARIGWAVEAVGRRTPWRSTCLVQAAAGKAMLRRRGIGSTLFIGVQQAEAASLKAHAWLQCGSRILTGASGHRAYRVLSAFS
jgi:hypothetical protein